MAVLINSAKNPLFAVEERVALLRECCKDIPNVTVESFDGLTVEFAKKRHASVMVRGLRAVTDFENEIQLAQTNHALMPGIETMFLATSIKWSYLSSTIVKEAARYGSNISKFVTGAKLWSAMLTMRSRSRRRMLPKVSTMENCHG